MTYTVTNTFVDGTLIKASEVNDNFTQAATQVSSTSAGHTHNGTDSKILQLDWDTCWADSVHAHSSDAEGGVIPIAYIQQIATSPSFTAGAYEFSAISAATLTTFNYVEIIMTATGSGGGVSPNVASNFKIQEKYTGGSYGDILGTTAWANLGGVNAGVTVSSTFSFFHTLTANDKANGMQVKILDTGSSAIGLIQVALRLVK
jgi:hypothetical protein